MDPNNILIIGYGEMGHAFEFLLRNFRPTVWQRSQTEQPLEQAAQNKQYVFFCVPANPVFEIARTIAPQLADNTVCLSISKGLDDAGRPAAQALKDALPENIPQGVIYGPMISEELCAGRPGFGELGMTDSKFCPQVLQLFEQSVLKLECYTDIIGLSWCAVLKNVYAMAFGMADELLLGDNVRGYFAVTALAELSRISQLLGGDSNTPYGLAGLGDLITTATSEDSHHHELGRKLARGDRSDLSGEGTHTLALIDKNKVFEYRQFALFNTIAAVVKGEIGAANGLKKLISN